MSKQGYCGICKYASGTSMPKSAAQTQFFKRDQNVAKACKIIKVLWT